MNTKNMLWAALSMTAALVMTACTNDDNMAETSAAPQDEVKTIPYTVTVGQGGDATTRATVADDPSDATNYHKTLYFATDDKLYITGTNISGTLDITGGTGTASATFSGDLTYTGEGSPASDLTLTATLVSAQQTVDTEVSVDAAGDVTVNYPTTTYCDDVATAVQKYSRLTGTSTYGEKSFTLSQQTAFLNFEITFEDGTAAGTELSAVVSNGGSAICTANVTTVTDEGVKAKFVLPVAKGTTLSSATVKMGEKEAISFGASQTLEGKVYNVKKTQANPYATAQLGDLFYSDGTFSSTLETGKTPIGVIAYLGTDAFSENGTTVNGSTFVGHGLVLCLKNAASSVAWSTNNSSPAYTGNAFVTDAAGLKRSEGVSGYSATVALASATDASTVYPAAYQARNYTDLAAPAGTTGWFLPSAQQWVKMIEGLGGLTDGAPSWGSWFDTTHTAADKWEAALSKAGSGNYDSMTSAYLWYWSSSEYSDNLAVRLNVDATGTGDGYGFTWRVDGKDKALSNYRVRPVLAF